MTSFGWKRKTGSHSKSVAAVFADNEDEDKTPRDIGWLPSAKKLKLNVVEDAKAKSHHLKSQGIVLAENKRYWEALKYWDQAIHLTPKDATLHEMKAQALLQVGESFPAVKAAEVAVRTDPTWWIAHQTLGRTQLGIGQLQMAVRSFSRAVHLNPADEELRTEDLAWAVKLLKDQSTLEQKEQTETVSTIPQTDIIDTEDPEEHSDSEEKCLKQDR